MVINPIVGVYIPIIRIPIKGEMTIPNTRSLDPGSCDSLAWKMSFLKLGVAETSSHHVGDFSIFPSIEEAKSKAFQVTSWVFFLSVWWDIVFIPWRKITVQISLYHHVQSPRPKMKVWKFLLGGLQHPRSKKDERTLRAVFFVARRANE